MWNFKENRYHQASLQKNKLPAMSMNLGMEKQFPVYKENGWSWLTAAEKILILNKATNKKDS